VHDVQMRVGWDDGGAVERRIARTNQEILALAQEITAGATYTAPIGTNKKHIYMLIVAIKMLNQGFYFVPAKDQRLFAEMRALAEDCGPSMQVTRLGLMITAPAMPIESEAG